MPATMPAAAPAPSISDPGANMVEQNTRACCASDPDKSVSEKIEKNTAAEEAVQEAVEPVDRSSCCATTARAKVALIDPA